MCLPPWLPSGSGSPATFRQNSHSRQPRLSLDSREGGGNAILKLQLRHIPETAKLELFANLSCFLQRNAHSAPQGAPPGHGAAWQLPRTDEGSGHFLYDSLFSGSNNILGVTVSSQKKCQGSHNSPPVIISPCVLIWFSVHEGSWEFRKTNIIPKAMNGLSLLGGYHFIGGWG